MQQKTIRTINKDNISFLSIDDRKEFIVKVFQLYVGLKLHFNSPYIIPSNGVVNNGFNEHSMNSRKDVSIFINVAEKFNYDIDEIKFAMVSSFIKKQDSWIGDIIHQDNIAFNEKRKSVFINLKYEFEKQISKVSDYLDIMDISLNEFLLINDSDRPLFIKKVRPTDEFAAVMDYFFPYLQQSTNNPLWKKRSFVLNKYKFLINIDNDLSVMFKNNFLK